MRRGPHARKELTRAKMVYAAVTLFLEKGYQDTKISDITERLRMTAPMFFSVFDDKESILRALVELMFQRQFETVEGELGGTGDPALIYGIETALQLHIAELSEALRDLYVTAYSLPTTSDTIFRLTAEKLEKLFKARRPDCEAKDFYELELATGGIARNYMAKPCDMHFTMERKISRFLELTLTVFNVPEAERKEVTGQVLGIDLHSAAQRLIADIAKRVKKDFEELQEFEKANGLPHNRPGRKPGIRSKQLK